MTPSHPQGQTRLPHGDVGEEELLEHGKNHHGVSGMRQTQGGHAITAPKVAVLSAFTFFSWEHSNELCSD